MSQNNHTESNVAFVSANSDEIRYYGNTTAVKQITSTTNQDFIYKQRPPNYWTYNTSSDAKPEHHIIRGKIRMTKEEYKKYCSLELNLDFSVKHEKSCLIISNYTCYNDYLIREFCEKISRIIKIPVINEILYMNPGNSTGKVYRIIPGYFEYNSIEFVPKKPKPSEKLFKELQICKTEKNIEKINKKIDFNL